MKKMIKLALTATMISSLYCLPAFAEESSPHSVYGWAAFMTDYYWRGYSQTDGEPAAQAEIGYEYAISKTSGVYAGIWGSNIYFPQEYVSDFEEWTYAEANSNLELDFWVGFWKEFGDVEVDLAVVYYYYPGSVDAGLVADPEIDDWVKGEAEADMFELHIGLAYRFNIPTTPKLSLGFDWSPNYTSQDGNSYHVNGILDFGLPYDFGLDLEVGYQSVEGDQTTGCDSTGFCYGQDGKAGFDYAYFRAGIDRDIFFDGLNLDLSFWYNNEEDWFNLEVNEDETEYGYATLADSKFILTLSYSF